jgi:hypothetical protein
VGFIFVAGVAALPASSRFLTSFGMTKAVEMTKVLAGMGAFWALGSWWG